VRLYFVLRLPPERWGALEPVDAFEDVLDLAFKDAVDADLGFGGSVLYAIAIGSSVTDGTLDRWLFSDGGSGLPTLDTVRDLDRGSGSPTLDTVRDLDGGGITYDELGLHVYPGGRSGLLALLL
jgi:hypothetical protein